ncbi:hypothetical protein LPJ53_004663 [Coemansia erecta]|uniref:Nucleic acid-binding protein n=1 Tax=Coemansia erecta TaxID=147472 RepID=A0A9W7XTX0_9FUNG|nr:hypothetical protein LPJ53_004663 [Coemansia erecta]
MFSSLLSRSAGNAKTLLAAVNKTQARSLNVSMNKVILIGNVGKDPEDHTFKNGGRLVSFPLATSRRYKDSEGNIVEQTFWHKIRLGGQSADNAMNLVKKGTLLQIDGSIRYDTYTNKDGIEVHSTSIQATDFKIQAFPKRKEGEEGRAAAAEEEED